MALIDDIQFEVERAPRLFKSTTTMPRNANGEGVPPLTFDSDPNTAVAENSDGEFLLANAPLGTGFIQQDGTKWFKSSGDLDGIWVTEGSGGSGGDVNGITYLSGDESTDGSWRVRIDDADAYNLERREGGTWSVKAFIENSVHTEYFYTTAALGGLYFNDGHDRSNMISSGTTNHHDVIIGSIKGNTTLVSHANNPPTITTEIQDAYWLTEVADFNDVYVTDNWGVDYDNFDSAIYTDQRLYLTELPTQPTYIRIQTIDRVTNRVISETSDQYLFAKDSAQYGHLITSTTIEIPYVGSIIAHAGDPARIEVTTSIPVSFKGLWAVPSGTANTFPHNDGLFFVHGAAKGSPFKVDVIATVNDVGASEYAEREADRAFTLHDIFGEGLATQDGEYLSFNHQQSPAFQQHTSGEYAWADHYIDPLTGGIIHTTHLHGDDSGLAGMDGIPLSFEPSVEVLNLASNDGDPWDIVWNTSNETEDWAKIPNLVLTFPHHHMNQRCHYYLEVFIRSPQVTLLTYDSKDKDRNSRGEFLHAFNEEIHLPPFDGSAVTSRINSIDVQWNLSFYNDSAVAHEITGVRTLTVPTESLVLADTGFTPTTVWEAVDDFDAVNGKFLPRIMVYPPAYTTNVPAKITLTISDELNPAVIYFNETLHSYETVHNTHNRWLGLPAQQVVSSSADMREYALKIVATAETLDGQISQVTHTGVRTDYLPFTDNYHTGYTTRSNGDDVVGTPGITIVDVWRDKWSFYFTIKASTYNDQFEGGAGWWVDDIEVHLKDDSITSFNLQLGAYIPEDNIPVFSEGGNLGHKFKIRVFDSSGTLRHISEDLTSSITYLRNYVRVDNALDPWAVALYTVLG